MDMETYQRKASAFAIYKDPLYPALGLTGEAGEFADKLAKLLRAAEFSGWNYLHIDDRLALADELGDVLWMVQACSKALNIPLGEIAARNIDKLDGRKRRGTIHGSGDVR